MKKRVDFQTAEISSFIVDDGISTSDRETTLENNHTVKLNTDVSVGLYSVGVVRLDDEWYTDTGFYEMHLVEESYIVLTCIFQKYYYEKKRGGKKKVLQYTIRDGKEYFWLYGTDGEALACFAESGSFPTPSQILHISMKDGNLRKQYDIFVNDEKLYTCSPCDEDILNKTYEILLFDE